MSLHLLRFPVQITIIFVLFALITIIANNTESKVALGQVLLQVLLHFLVSIIPPLPSTHSRYSILLISRTSKRAFTQSNACTEMEQY